MMYTANARAEAKPISLAPPRRPTVALERSCNIA